MRIRMVLFLACIVSTFLVNASAKRVIVGVLEDIPPAYLGASDVREVRVVFEKSGGEWRPFPNRCPDIECLETIISEYPAEVSWTIAYHGQRLGNLCSRARKIDFYAHIGLQTIVSSDSVPTIGEKSDIYATFGSGGPLYRPLIAVSQPDFKDPESWKSTEIPSELFTAFRLQFRQKYPALCSIDRRDETVKPFAYREEDIELGKSYTSNKGWTIAQLLLKDAIDCDADVPMVGIAPWFVSDPQDSIQYLDEGIWLIDTGDYDGDGRSELIFQVDGYNLGGYELYYDDFKKHALFEFGYH